MSKICESIRVNLSAYFDNELSAEKCTQIAEHLRLCPDCAQELATLKGASECCTEIKAVPEVPDQWNQIRSQLQSTSRKSAPFFSFVWPRWIPVAASFFLLIILGSIFWPSSPNRDTDVEPYFGLYLLAVRASDVLSSQISPQEIQALNLDFPVHTPSVLEAWSQKGIYFHKLHGQPMIQIFYGNAAGDSYCVFEQSENDSLDFGNRETRQELIQNQICTKFASQDFHLISWTLGNTLFTVVSTAGSVDLDSVTYDWIGEIRAEGER